MERARAVGVEMTMRSGSTTSPTEEIVRATRSTQSSSGAWASSRRRSRAAEISPAVKRLPRCTLPDRTRPEWIPRATRM